MPVCTSRILTELMYRSFISGDLAKAQLVAEILDEWRALNALTATAAALVIFLSQPLWAEVVERTKMRDGTAVAHLPFQIFVETARAAGGIARWPNWWKCRTNAEGEVADGNCPSGPGLCRRVARGNARRDRGGRRHVPDNAGGP